MPHKLAKQLKDAGFPQTGNNRDVDGGMMTMYEPDEVYILALSELI